MKKWSAGSVFRKNWKLLINKISKYEKTINDDGISYVDGISFCTAQVGYQYE